MRTFFGAIPVVVVMMGVLGKVPCRGLRRRLTKVSNSTVQASSSNAAARLATRMPMATPMPPKRTATATRSVMRSTKGVLPALPKAMVPLQRFAMLNS